MYGSKGEAVMICNVMVLRIMDSVTESLRNVTIIRSVTKRYGATSVVTVGNE